MKKFFFFDSIDGDRKYLASDISKAFGIAIGTGLKPEKDSFKIVPYENMTVKMLPGGAMIFGHGVIDDDEDLITIDTAHSELNRIDRIVVRYDKWERSIKTVLIKGTPALTPTAPVVLRTENQFDLVLADITVAKATTSIAESNIKDMRNSDLCGFLGVKISPALQKLIDSKADASTYSDKGIFIGDEISIRRDDEHKNVYIYNKKVKKFLTLRDDGNLSYDDSNVALVRKPVRTFKATLKYNEQREFTHGLGYVPITTVSTSLGNVMPTFQVDENKILIFNWNNTTSKNECSFWIYCW